MRSSRRARAIRVFAMFAFKSRVRSFAPTDLASYILGASLYVWLLLLGFRLA